MDLPITMAPALLKLNYDVQRDLIPIAAVVKSGNVLVVHPATKIHSMAELVAGQTWSVDLRFGGSCLARAHVRRNDQAASRH